MVLLKFKVRHRSASEVDWGSTFGTAKFVDVIRLAHHDQFND
jgi:hypothetical protein